MGPQMIGLDSKTCLQHKLITNQFPQREKFGYLLELVDPHIRDRFANLKPGEKGYQTA
jgi:hypothetical protein